MYDNNGSEVERGEIEVYYCNTIRAVVYYHMKVDCGKLKKYTRNPGLLAKMEV